VHIVIMGCGRVGSTIAHILEDQGHSVAVIDRDPEAFRKLSSGFKGSRITGIGFDRDILIEAGIEHADAFAAVSSGDNSNVIAARVARESFGVERVVARIYDPRRAVIYQRLGIPTVATVSWTTDQVMRRLLPEELAADWVDASGQVSLVERALPATWAGKRLAGLSEPGRFTLAAVTRLGAAQVPSSELVGQEGDILHFVVETVSLDSLQERLIGPAEGGH
jgi:trk system potassium uptake protein